MKTFKCPCCGSSDIGSDASARWNAIKQEWELAGVHDNKYCNACGADEITPIEIDLHQTREIAHA